jgi:hypothetical protein
VLYPTELRGHRSCIVLLFTFKIRYSLLSFFVKTGQIFISICAQHGSS